MSVNKKPMFVLDGDDIIAHMNKQSKLNDEQFRYFHYASKVWRAIQEHIERAADCVLIDRFGGLEYHRGSSSVSFRAAHTYSSQWRQEPETFKSIEIPATHFNIRFTVDYADPDGREYRDGPTKTYSLDVPIELELNFTTDKFNEWVQVLRKERDDKRCRHDAELLRDLMTRNPDLEVRGNLQPDYIVQQRGLLKKEKKK